MRGSFFFLRGVSLLLCSMLCCNLPIWLLPLVLLILISLFMANVSWLGHVCGMIMGLFYIRGLLLPLTPPRKWVLQFERCLPTWLVNRPGWRPTPEEDPFLSWQPSFCIAPGCPDLPQCDGQACRWQCWNRCLAMFRGGNRAGVAAGAPAAAAPGVASSGPEGSNRSGRPLGRLLGVQVSASAGPGPSAVVMHPDPNNQTEGQGNIPVGPASNVQPSAPGAPQAQLSNGNEGRNRGDYAGVAGGSASAPPTTASAGSSSSGNKTSVRRPVEDDDDDIYDVAVRVTDARRSSSSSNSSPGSQPLLQEERAPSPSQFGVSLQPLGQNNSAVARLAAGADEFAASGYAVQANYERSSNGEYSKMSSDDV